jgi:hypothetical protein
MLPAMTIIHRMPANAIMLLLSLAFMQCSQPEPGSEAHIKKVTEAIDDD